MCASLKYMLTAGAISLLAICANAQDLARLESNSIRIEQLTPAIAASGREVAYKVSRPPGLRMKKTGMTLTIAGAALLLTGIIVLSNADGLYHEYSSGGYTYIEYDSRAVGGQALIGIGAGMAIPGIIFWTKGAKKYNRYKEREAAFNFRPGGFSFSYKF